MPCAAGNAPFAYAAATKTAVYGEKIFSFGRPCVGIGRKVLRRYLGDRMSAEDGRGLVGSVAPSRVRPCFARDDSPESFTARGRGIPNSEFAIPRIPPNGLAGEVAQTLSLSPPRTTKKRAGPNAGEKGFSDAL